MKVHLADIAYARSGDKGAHANIGVWVHNDEAYDFVLGALTADVGREHCASLRPDAVARYELPNIRALNFVLYGVLGAGVAGGGLRSDAQAKTYSARILSIELEGPAVRLSL